MNCIHCGQKNTSVKNSRSTKGGLFIWRRRACEKCSTIFTTKESPLGDNLFVTKRSGRRQRFFYEKLLVSIVYAIERGKHNDRGNQAKLAKTIAEKILTTLLKRNNKEVRTADIIELCYANLHRADPHFAEMYMHYSEFRQKICFPLRAKLDRQA